MWIDTSVEFEEINSDDDDCALDVEECFVSFQMFAVERKQDSSSRLLLSA